MCVIISIYNNKNDHSKDEFLRDNLFNFNTWNADGMGFFGHDTKNKSKGSLLRKLKVTGSEIFEPLLKKYNVGHFHFRNATQGDVTLENVHFWKFKNWVMSHNGQVWGSDKVKELSDSNLLFRELTKAGAFDETTIDINKINKIVRSKNFWGRLLFVNTKTKDSYYFGDFYLTNINKNILVVSTKELSKSKLSLYGIEFETGANEIVTQKIEGIFKINADKQSFKMYKLDFNLDFNEVMSSPYDDYESEIDNYNYGYGYQAKKWDRKRELRERHLPI